ncbi:MAG TPA: hypothetical protein VGM87_20860 [Roseomonas sp.]
MLLAVGPVLLLLALLCAVTRQLRILPEERVVLVTRRLLGLTFTRRLPVARDGRLAVTMRILRPRLSASDRTLAGDQIHTHYTVWLRGHGAIRIADFHNTGDPAGTRRAAEDLAVGLAGRLGLRAERRGYGLQAGPDGAMLAAPRRGRVAPLP